jgi:hypothetical protein
MDKKLRGFFAGLALGLASLAPIPLQALEIEPHAKIEIAYVPGRSNAYSYANEAKGKVGVGLEAKLIKDLSFSLGGNIEAYLNPDFSKIDYSEIGIEAKADYKNLEVYGSYSLGGSSSTLDLKNILSFGVRFKLGNEPNKDSNHIELNSYGNLDMAYVPFRSQYNTNCFYEIKTAITGNVVIDYLNFFIKAGGTERSYENDLGSFSFFPNIQEYETFASAGYGAFEFYFFHECDHFEDLLWINPHGSGETNFGIKYEW